MAKIQLINIKGEKLKDITLADNVWNIEANDIVLKRAIDLQLAATRQGTAKTKTRSEVSGGGRKPWRQKGTGRARQGSIRSVQWVGGGNYGTPVPRDYSKKQNRKERQLAIRTALTEKVEELSKNIKFAEAKELFKGKNGEVYTLCKSIRGNTRGNSVANRIIRRILL